MTLILFVYVSDTARAVPCCIAYGVGIVSFIHSLRSVWRCLILMNADKSSRLSFVYPYADFGGLAGILIISMKLKTWLLMSLIALSITACEYDDSALKADVNDLKDRITALEEQVNQMNEDIVSLQDIIHALDQNISISQVEQTDEGYILHLTDGTSINLYNGKEGSSGANAPIIGIAQENGIYYWTLTTDEKTTWLTDEAGNKLPVSGASGITPLLSIDEKGYWTVSYDNGKIYEQLTDANGNPVQAVGKDGADGTDGKPGTPGTPGNDGDSFFQNVTQDDEKVTLILSNGTIINIPKVKPFGITFQQTTNIPLGKEGITLSYTITGADADTQVRAFVSKGDLEVTLSEKNIFVKPKSNASVNGSEVIVLLFNKEKTITTLLTFIDAPKDVNTDGSTEDYKVEEGTWDE